MGKVLTLRPGEDFYLDDDRYMLAQAVSPTAAVIQRERDGATFTPTDEQSVEIAPSVFVSSGTRGQWGLARVVVETPQAVRIRPGSDYRKTCTAP